MSAPRPGQGGRGVMHEVAPLLIRPRCIEPTQQARVALRGARLSNEMPTHDEIKAAGGNDVGDWGEKQLATYEGGPLMIDGEPVDVSKLPKFGDDERPEDEPSGADQ